MVMVITPNSLDSTSPRNLLSAAVMVRPALEDRAVVVDMVVVQVEQEPRGKVVLGVLAFIVPPVIHRAEEGEPVEQVVTQVVAAPRALVELDLITT